jgi:hypothetical protein
LLAGCVLYAVSKLSTSKVATAEMYTREFISKDGGTCRVAIQSIVNPANLNKFGGYWFSPRGGDRPVRPTHFIIMETDINKLYSSQSSKFKSQVSEVFGSVWIQQDASINCPREFRIVSLAI